MHREIEEEDGKDDDGKSVRDGGGVEAKLPIRKGNGKCKEGSRSDGRQGSEISPSLRHDDEGDGVSVMHQSQLSPAEEELSL